MTPEPDEAQDEPTYQTFTLAFPSDLEIKQVNAWLVAMAGLLRTRSGGFGGRPSIVFELWADARGITYRLKLPPSSADYAATQLRTLVPGVRVTPERTSPKHGWVDAIEFGQSNPNGTLRIPNPESLSGSLLASVQGLKASEAILMQWVVVPAANVVLPDKKAARSSGNGARDMFVISEPGSDSELDDRRSKLATPNMLAVCRVGARATKDARASHLLANVQAAMASVSSPHNRMKKRVVWNKARLLERLEYASGQFRYPMQVSLTELAACLAWPIGQPYVAGLPRGGTRHLPATGDIPKSGGPVIMTSDFPGAERRLCITPHDLCMHAIAVGSPGTGKTNLLTNMARELLDKGHGVICIETKGDTDQALSYELIQRIPEHRVDDVIIVDVADSKYATGYNLLMDGNPRIAVEQLCALFEHLYRDTRGVWTREVLYFGLMTLISQPGYTFADLASLLSPRNRVETAWRDELLAGLTDSECQDFWQRFKEQPKSQQERFVAPVLDRIWQLNRSEIRRIIGQSKSSFNMREVLEQNKILLINLSGVGEATAELAGTLFVNSLWSAIRSSKVKRPNFLFLDEFAALMDLPVKMDEVLARSRGYQCGMVLATQHLSQLPLEMRSAVISNARTKICFQGGGEDARLFSREFGFGLSEGDFKNLERYQAIARLVAEGRVSSPVTGTTLPPSKPTGLGGLVRWKARKRYSRPVAEIEAEIRERRKPKAEPPKKPKVGPQEWS